MHSNVIATNSLRNEKNRTTSLANNKEFNKVIYHRNKAAGHTVCRNCFVKDQWIARLVPERYSFCDQFLLIRPTLQICFTVAMWQSKSISMGSSTGKSHVAIENITWNTDSAIAGAQSFPFHAESRRNSL